MQLAGPLASDPGAPITISNQYSNNALDAVNALTSGKTQIKTITYSHYFGNWQHTPCLTDMASPEDGASFNVNITAPGDYKISIEYACTPSAAGQEGALNFNGKDYRFETLQTSDYDSHKPFLFIKKAIAVSTVAKAGIYRLSIHPLHNGTELFKLKTIWLEPVDTQ